MQARLNRAADTSGALCARTLVLTKRTAHFPNGAARFHLQLPSRFDLRRRQRGGLKST